MKTAFFGTPETAVPSLQALVGFGDVVGVVTRPDAPRGRSGRPQPSPVASFAEDMGIPVHRPEDRAGLAAVCQQMDFEVGVVVAFGMILRPEVLDVPRHGFVNVHFSLLPRWRGAAPVARAILAGDTRTGVSIMAMDEGLDTGPVIATWSTAVGAAEDAVELTARLAVHGGRMLSSVLGDHLDGRIALTPQNGSEATYAEKLRSDERWIHSGQSAAEAAAAVRGLAAWPGAWIEHDTGPVRIRRARQVAVSARSGPVPAGSVSVRDGAVVLGFGTGSMEVFEVQPAGRRSMEASAWARGLHGDGGRFR